MQAVQKSLIDIIFTSNMSIFYKDDNLKCCYQVVIFNILMCIFIDRCIMNIIKKYKQSVLNFIPYHSTKDKDVNLQVILNNNNMTWLFGWAIKKFKTKYLRTMEHLALHNVSIGKL